MNKNAITSIFGQDLMSQGREKPVSP